MNPRPKSYAESKFFNPFDWRHWLKRADKEDPEAISAVVRKSKGWVTCACGNQCAAIPRNKLGRPIDARLADLGYDFTTAVTFYQFRKALTILARIERRSAQILKGLRK